MSDRHMRILRVLARHSERRLDDHDDTTPARPDARARARRGELQRAATRAREQVTGARARRERDAGPPR